MLRDYISMSPTRKTGELFTKRETGTRWREKDLSV
jgi:hypothetical protein